MNRPPLSEVDWPDARRIIRSLYPPIDLFEDIADPADWPLLISAEQKTNPRIMETIGNLELVPEARRVGGPGASYLMAPFTHISTNRPSRFSAGRFGVLYVGDRFEVALMETIHHHEAFMAATAEKPGWTSSFREIVMGVKARLHDIRVEVEAGWIDPQDYTGSQALGSELHADGSEGIVYRSVRYPDGEAAALFYPDLASDPVQGRHLDYHWNGARVDYVRDAGFGDVFRVVHAERQDS